ncbi:MAG: hypothetical protein ACREHD_02760 [Pirellulales bacterium]
MSAYDANSGSGIGEQARRIALFCVPTLVFLLITAYWRHKGNDHPTGDETFYLFVTESIIDDVDVDVKNNLRKFGFLSADVHESQCIAGPHGWFSVHNLGLSALLAVPWAVRGVWGARLMMALCCGLAAPVIYRGIHRTWQCPQSSFMFSMALALGMPLLHACNQIYPDLPAGILLLFAAERALAAEPAARTVHWRDLLFPAALVLLPWLHIKYIAPAFIVLAWSLDATRDRRVLAHAAALAVSLVVLAYYNAYAFGQVTGPYSDDGLLLCRNSLIVFLGLHFYQGQGMFLQQPLWLLGLIGLAPMWRSARRSCLWWLLLYASTVVPNSLHPNWYGGYSYLGRFGVTGALLWTIPLAYGARMIFANGKTAPALVAVLSLALQIGLANHWLRADSLEFGCAWPESIRDCHSAYPSFLKPYLPYWLPDANAWRYTANYAALILAGGLLACGKFWQRRCICEPRRVLSTFQVRPASKKTRWLGQSISDASAPESPGRRPASAATVSSFSEVE